MGKLGDIMLGFKSVMQSDRPVFTDLEGIGIQPMVIFDLSGLRKPIRKLLAYSGLLSAMDTSKYKAATVFGGRTAKGDQPRISFGYKEKEGEKEGEKKGSTPVPPKTGSVHPGYAFGDYLSELYRENACA